MMTTFKGNAPLWKCRRIINNMNDKDRLTVENFVSTGMELETLYTCFPDFSREEVADIFNQYKEKNHSICDDTNNLSINCS